MHLALLQAAEDISTMDSIPWIDKLAIVLLGLFVALGLWRGLWWQVIRFVGFVGAFAAARLFSPKAEPLITKTFNIMDPRFSQGLAWIVIFIAALILVVLLGKLGKSMLEAMKLGMVDRLGGALAGALTALLIHSAFLAVLSLFAQGEWLHDQLVGSWSENLFDVLAEEYPVIVDEQQATWIGNQLRPNLIK
jgi:membrane protein required for colicin V production